MNYRKALQAQPGMGEAYYRLGLSFLKAKKMSEAQEAFSGAVRIAPDLTEAKSELAKLDLEAYAADPRRPKRLYDEIRKLSLDLLSKDERSVEGLRFQGELALLDRSPVDAIAAFRKAYEIQPTHPEVVHGLVRALIDSNQYLEAEKLALVFLAKNKTYGLIYDDLYALYRLTKRPGEAEQIFQAKVANNPGSIIYRLQLAAHFINDKNQTKMEAALQPLITDTKRFPDGRLEVGQFYARLSMWEKAQSVYEDVVKNDPTNKLKARKLIIQTALGQKKTAEANMAAEEAVREFPEDPEARYLRASLWVDSKDHAKTKAAINELEQLREKQQKIPMYWYVLGQAYEGVGDDKRAEASYRESLKVNPGFTTGLIALAELNLTKGQAKAAQEFINQLAPLAENDPRIKLLRSRALLESGRTGEARAELASLARTYPEKAIVQLQYGMTLLAERQYDQAEGIFKRFYLPGQSDLQPLEGLARTYGARGQGNRAFNLVEAELKRNPQSKGLRRLMAQVAVAEKRPDVAVEQYRELIRMEPQVGIHHYQLAQALRMKGEVSEAIQSLEKVEQLEPDNPGPLSVLAFILQESGRTNEAEKRLRRLVQLRPDDSNLQNNLAYLLADTGGNLDEAMNLVQKSLQKSSGNPNYMDTLGLVYLKKGMTDAAVQTFRATVRKNPDNALYLQHLGLALIEQGQQIEGRTILQNALKKKPGKADEMRILEALKRTG